MTNRPTQALTSLDTLGLPLAWAVSFGLFTPGLLMAARPAVPVTPQSTAR